MTWLDWFAGAAAGYASACLHLRAQALKPHMGDYPMGPLDVRAALFALSLILGAYAVVVFFGDYQATRTEALLVGAVAWTAHVLWRNVRRQSASRSGFSPEGAGPEAPCSIDPAPSPRPTRRQA
ncbi:hypothetical protein D3C72_1340600 [compost metagenome]